MEIDVSQDEGRVPVTVFRLKGDLAGEEPLQSQAQEAYDAGTRYLLLDLSTVPYITSAGLRAIHFVFDLMRGDAPDEEGQIVDHCDEVVRRGIATGDYTSGHLKLFKPSKNAKKALSLAGYDMFLEIHKNYGKAITSF